MKQKLVLLPLCLILLTLGLGRAGAAEAARQLVPLDRGGVPGVIIDTTTDSQRIYFGSPSIAVMPNGDYVASHDYFGPGTTFSRMAVFSSSDRGQSWKKLCDLEGQWWSTLFVHKGALYLIGTTREYGNVAIRRSRDGGKTWTTPRGPASGLLFKGSYHCAPVPVVVHDGRVWRAFERSMDPKKPRAFESVVISAPVGANLLRAESWTPTNQVKIDPGWMGVKKAEWLEGNVVVTPEGGIANILRLDADAGLKAPIEFSGVAAGHSRYETAVMMNVAKDGKTETFDPQTGFIPFPGSRSKFTIRFDPVSKKYWSLVQKITNFDNSQFSPSGQRNVLALTSSSDLRQWKVETFIVRYNEGKAIPGKENKVGFQYVDWLFDGNDMIAACRTAWGDSHSFHDANYLTFLRIKNFRKLTPADAPADLAEKK